MAPRVLWLLLVPLVGCGGSDAQCVIDTDCPLFNRCSAQQCVPIGADASIDTSVPTDAAPDTTVTDAAADTGPTLLGTGTVSVGQTPLPGTMATYLMSAGFTPSMGAPGGCSTTEVGSCSILECITAPPMDAGMPDGSMGDAGMPATPSAGAIDLTGGLLPLSVTPSADGTYPAATGSGFVFSGGESLSITAAGEGIPAFAQSLSAPHPVNVTAPSFVPGALSIDRALDFPVTWTTAAAMPGNVVISLSGSEAPPAGGSRFVSVTCTHDGASLSATIPASVLANLPGAGATGALSIETRSSAELMAGQWAVTLSATNGAVADTGGAATASVTYP